MGRPKGIERPPGSGRAPGTPNKITATVKERLLEVFQIVNSDPTHPANLEALARKSPKEFNFIASKLIPTEVNATISEVKLSVKRNGPSDASRAQESPE